MKKTLAILFIQLLAWQWVAAQDNDYQPAGGGINTDALRFGVFFAPNISWMKPTANKSDNRQYDVSSNGSRTGYSWGLMVDYYFSENYGISSGFHLNTTGGKIIASANPTAPTAPTPPYVSYANFSYRLQYLEIPANLKIRSDELTGGLRIFGNIGAGLGINISKKATYEVRYYKPLAVGAVEGVVTGENEKLTGTLAITPAILQLQLGAGVEYPLSDKISLYSGLFFNNGFAPDVTNPKEYKIGYDGSFTDGSIRLNNFALRIGLLF